MLNSDDPELRSSLLKLQAVIVNESKPLVVWVGAGASRWAGLPSWLELAKAFRRKFHDLCAGFDNASAVDALSRSDLPFVFDLCKRCDEGMYHSTLVDSLKVEDVPAKYKAFTAKLASIKDIKVITTNADLLLEQHLVPSDVIERSDISRFPVEVVKPGRSIVKIHGSVSSVQSLVFSTEDYQGLTSNEAYLKVIESIFTGCSVLFFAYGVQDKYVIDQLLATHGKNKLFGSGPHFLVAPSGAPSPSIPGLHLIRYNADNRTEHLSSITILDVVQQYIELRKPKETALVELEASHKEFPAKGDTPSGFYIADFRPPGHHVTGQTLELTKRDGPTQIRAIVGEGWTPGEEPTQVSRALHDLLVGLLCFDVTYIPLSFIASVNESIGDLVLLPLLRSGALKFVNLNSHAGVLFHHNEEVFGHLGVMSGSLAGQTSARSIIEQHVSGVPGRANEFEAFVEVAVAATVESRLQPENFTSCVRSALLMPKVSKLLGFSQSILPTQTPSWLAFPLLRLANVVAIGDVGNSIGATAARLPYGGQALLSAAFATSAAEQFVDVHAGYVLAQSLAINLGTFIETDRRVLLKILDFRSTQDGIAFRTEIKEVLRADAYNDFSLSVDAGLKRTISSVVLEKAARQMQSLLRSSLAPVKAIWGDPLFGDAITERWKVKSRQRLLSLMENRKIKPNSSCVCGSDLPIKQCCLKALD